jgi:hypothetical protein
MTGRRGFSPLHYINSICLQISHVESKPLSCLDDCTSLSHSYTRSGGVHSARRRILRERHCLLEVLEIGFLRHPGSATFTQFVSACRATVNPFSHIAKSLGRYRTREAIKIGQLTIRITFRVWGSTREIIEVEIIRLIQFEGLPLYAMSLLDLLYDYGLDVWRMDVIIIQINGLYLWYGIEVRCQCQ